MVQPNKKLRWLPRGPRLWALLIVTVFVLFLMIYEGLDVLEKMSLVKTDESEWPLEPLVMQVEIIQ